MAIINSSVLLGIADRCAYQYGLFLAPLTAANITGTGFYWQRITATEDPDVEIPLLSPYYNIDYNGITQTTLYRNGLNALQSIVTNMDTHFTRVGWTTSWDGYLQDQDERVSDYFNQVYKLAKGSFMLANNVFSEDENEFCTWTNSGGFVDGTNYGDGSWSNKADGTKFAPTQLKVVADTGSTAISSFNFTLEGKDEDNNVKSLVVGPIALANPGDELDLGTATDLWLDVTGMSSISGGASGNAIKIVNKKERQIAM